MKNSNPSASFELLLVMTALQMQDKLTELESKMGIKSDMVMAHESEKFAETLSTIAEYLESLAHKIGK